MKVIEIPFCFYPDSVGGTEIYVESFSLELRHHGIDAVVAAPAKKGSEGSYYHNGIRVRRFRESQSGLDLEELYGEGDKQAAAEFARILDEERPELVHLHAFSPACSLRLVREARKRGTPVLFTYHTPTVSCQRGTLMRWGSELCDGMLDVGLCTRCTLHGLGLPRGIADLIGCVPVSFGQRLGAFGLSGGAWTALRMRELIQARHSAFRELVTEVDHVVAVCDWVRDLLTLNAVPAGKITLCRQGVNRDARCESSGRPSSAALNSQRSLFNSRNPLRIAFLGRLDSTKGVHILIQALGLARDFPIVLDIYGVSQGETGRAYLSHLESLAGRDARVSFHPAMPARETVGRLREYDLLAVPSQLQETGPLVVLEAFAAGIPVLGSRLGGIAELVVHGVNGLLVEAGSVEAWCQALTRISKDGGLLAHLRNGVLPPRGMEEVAEEMASLYHNVFREKAARREAAAIG